MDILIWLNSGSLGVPFPLTPISHLLDRSISFQHNPHVCWCICSILVWAYKVCCGRTWAQALTHRQFCFLILELVTSQVLFEQPNKFYHWCCIHMHPFFCWSDGSTSWMSDSFRMCSTSIHLCQLWILMGPSVDVIYLSDCISSWFQGCHGIQGTEFSDVRGVIAFWMLYRLCTQFMAWRLQAKQVRITGNLDSWLTFRHHASSVWDRCFATLQRTLFVYLINKYISLYDIRLTMHHWYK